MLVGFNFAQNIKTFIKKFTCTCVAKVVVAGTKTHTTNKASGGCHCCYAPTIILRMLYHNPIGGNTLFSIGSSDHVPRQQVMFTAGHSHFPQWQVNISHVVVAGHAQLRRKTTAVSCCFLSGGMFVCVICWPLVNTKVVGVVVVATSTYTLLLLHKPSASSSDDSEESQRPDRGQFTGTICWGFRRKGKRRYWILDHILDNSQCKVKVMWCIAGGPCSYLLPFLATRRKLNYRLKQPASRNSMPGFFWKFASARRGRRTPLFCFVVYIKRF